MAQTGSAPLISRAIPGSGERIPAVGLGTAYVFDTDDDKTRHMAEQVIGALVDAGGRLIDTASSYGDAESVIGNVLSTTRLRDKVFIATKLEEPDEAELKRSLMRLKASKVDVLQLHNVRDKAQSLAAFRAWQAQGICRYIGITSTSHGDFDAVEAILAREKPDFVQIDYSLDDRSAESRILPVAAEVKAGEMQLEASPNPFKTSIRFQVSGAGKGLSTEIKIFDLSGKLVKTLAPAASNQNLSCAWDASAMPAGVYLAQLKAGSKVLSKQVLLLK